MVNDINQWYGAEPIDPVAVAPAVKSPVARSRLRGIAAVAGIFLLLASGYLAVCGRVVSVITQTERETIVSSPHQYGLNYEDVEFPAAIDGMKLSGWLIRAHSSDRLVIFVHGKGHHRDASDIQSLSLAARLAAQGFNILMFDLRGYGQSQGKRFSLGFYETRDVRGAVNYAMARGFKPGHIGVIGWSMGAATVLMAAENDRRIGAVVADSAYADLHELLSDEVPKQSGLPSAFTPGILLMARLLYGIDVDGITPVVAVTRIAPRHILLIHSAGDPLIPVKHAFRLYGAIGLVPGNELWVSPGSNHVSAYRSQPMVYAKRVGNFFRKNLK